MLTFSSSLTIRSLIAGLALVAVSGAATADERRTLEGVVESVDYASKSVTVIEEKTGETVTYSFDGNAPTIDVNGRKLTDMSTVKPGQEVALKLVKTTTPEPQEPDSDRFVKGEILEVNLEQNIALIRPEDGGRPQVIDLPQNLAVSGLHSGADVTDLQEGQFVTLKYSVR